MKVARNTFDLQLAISWSNHEGTIDCNKGNNGCTATGEVFELYYYFPA